MSLDFDFFYNEPPKQLNDLFTNEISLANVGAIRQYPYGSRYNINFGDADTHRNVIEDVLLYKKYGGGTIVENSSHGLKRNLRFLYDVSIGTGVHLVAGTGHYINNVQSEEHLGLSVENMVKLYVEEIKNGVDLNGDGKTFVKCGFIGEVGSVYPIHEFERKAIEATALAQQQLQCPVSFHPGRDAEAPFEIVRLYLEAGGKPERCVMSHLDRKNIAIVSFIIALKNSLSFVSLQERFSILPSCWNSPSWEFIVSSICSAQSVHTTN